MKQKFHIKHLSSWSPLVQKFLQHIAGHTEDSSTFPAKGLFMIYSAYTARPNGIYEYDLTRDGNAYLLHEDEELVLHIELIDVHELKEIPY